MFGRGGWVVMLVVSGCLPFEAPDGGSTIDSGVVVGDAGSTDAGTPDSGVVEPDAGAPDAGEPDAGQPDAGQLDAGPPDARIDAVLLEVSADDRRIRLIWDAGPGSAPGWIVLRSGLPIAQLTGAAREYDDFTAPAGALEGFDASATRGLPEGIELDWSKPTSRAGARVSYLVRTLADVSVSSNEVEGERAAPTLLGFEVQRGDGGWSFSPLQTTWLDVTAPSPTVTGSYLQVTADPHDQTSSVILRASSDLSRVVRDQGYTLRAKASAGDDLEALVTGDRGGHRVEYQWQRSTHDSPDAFLDLPFVHGRFWLDPEAVLGEGRYYRVIARAGGAEWISAPVRALLHRPLFVAGDQTSSYVVRDDYTCVPLGYSRVQLTQFPPLRDFVVANDMPCGLLFDGGVDCVQPNGAHGIMPLPPATSLTGGAVLCVTTDDAGAACTPSRFDVSDMERVIASSSTRLCGQARDGGVRCLTPLVEPNFPLVLDPPPSALWLSSDRDWVTAVQPDGSIAGFGTTSVLPPTDPAGYVAGSQTRQGACGQRADGLVRCTSEHHGNWPETPPLSAVAWQHAFLGPVGLCGLTSEGRVRCGTARLIPPRPPVRSLSVVHSEAMALTADGALDARGGQLPVKFVPAVDDRFSSTSRFTYSNQCVLRADGGATCNGVTATEPLRQVAAGFGLKEDGGIYSWGTAWPSPGVFSKIIDVTSTVCALRSDARWVCADPGQDPPPGVFTQLTGWGNSGCGLTPGGKLTCWGNQPPERVTQHRFRHLAPGIIPCATTVEGEVMCWNGGWAPLPWDDFVEFHQEAIGCGIRRDGTMACRSPYSFPWDLTP